MAQLKYCDKHNQVGFLRKPDESAGFAEIVDFLRGSNLMYALTTNPTIYDSLVKQFWQTATAKTLANGTLELHTTIDTITYTITEASIRNKLKLAYASGITMLPTMRFLRGWAYGIFGNMKRGFRGVPRPLLPAMLSIANSSTGQETPSVTQPQPSSSVEIGDLLLRPQQVIIGGTLGQTSIIIVDLLLLELKNMVDRGIFDSGCSGHMTGNKDQLEDFEEFNGGSVTFGEEETKAQGRKTHNLDPLVSLVQELVTPLNNVNASEEEQVEDISPTTLEAAAILTKVKKINSVDKGKRYKRRKSSKESAGISLDFEEVKSAFEEVNTGGIKVSAGIEEINAGSLDVNTGSDPVTTDSIRVSVPSPDREEAGLAEAIRLDALEKALEKEEVAKQWNKKKRKAQVQFEAQSYTEEDWDNIRAKLEANVELKESVLGKDLTVEDYAKKDGRVDKSKKKTLCRGKSLETKKVNQNMTQTHSSGDYMSNFLKKSKRTWKLTQLKEVEF
ncbi:hypothetical protein Tco_0838204 [Tanacetum coccineum]|uniref:Retrovirus-related Pol polyprotein from transposon TNT 1-94-like beta-barrel domain-containing protein n=1 Tax=Tanacetum coccineum TaxID=301880 RepID=A0ABQ5AQ25_9ASTR